MGPFTRIHCPKIHEMLRSCELGVRNTYRAGVLHATSYGTSYSSACVAICGGELILQSPFFAQVSLARNVRCLCVYWKNSARELSTDKNPCKMNYPAQRLNSCQTLLEVLLMAVPYLFYCCCGRRIPS